MRERDTGIVSQADRNDSMNIKDMSWYKKVRGSEKSREKGQTYGNEGEQTENKDDGLEKELRKGLREVPFL